MELDIRRLTPDLLDDYLYFFDNVAFADHKDWSQCYCMHFHWQSEWDYEPKKSSRDRVIGHIKNGIVQGYLAYSNGNVTGWCNTNDKNDYAALKSRNELWDENNNNQKTKAVVCFLVAPNMRGKGIASRLMKRVLSDAVTERYDYVEGYPPAEDCDMYIAHHGTIPFFARHGFSIFKNLGHDVIMRKRIEERVE